MADPPSGHRQGSGLLQRYNRLKGGDMTSTSLGAHSSKPLHLPLQIRHKGYARYALSMELFFGSRGHNFHIKCLAKGGEVVVKGG